MVVKKKKKEAVKELKEGTAKVDYFGTTIIVDALHALTVLKKNGGNILDINMNLVKSILFCENYEIPVPKPSTKSNVMEAIIKRFY
jgi:hypothetical protein|tara:strand:+ start:1994 stop:2251 length:258 start_codon:yes stop_codon:yes gene_type:complete